MSGASPRAYVMAIADHRQPSEYLYLLLDRAAGAIAQGALQVGNVPVAIDSLPHAPVPRPDLRATPEAWPLLVTLAGPGQALAAAILEASAYQATVETGRQRRRICGWLISAMDPQQMSAYLLAMCTFKGSMPSFLPLYEPLRMELMFAIDHEVGATRLGPIREWLIAASGGTSLLVRGRGAGIEAGSPAVWTPDLKQAQADASLVAEVIATWRRMLRSDGFASLRIYHTRPQLPTNAGTRAIRQVRVCQRMGLQRKEDVQCLALHQLMLHPQVHTHRAVAQRIDQALRREGSLEELLGQLSVPQWERIVESLMQAGASRS